MNILMNCTEFKKLFPWAAFPECKKAGQRPSWATVEKILKENKATIGEALIEYGFKPGVEYHVDQGQDSRVVVMHTGYDKNHRPTYGFDKALMLKWIFNYF